MMTSSARRDLERRERRKEGDGYWKDDSLLRVGVCSYFVICFKLDNVFPFLYLCVTLFMTTDYLFHAT